MGQAKREWEEALARGFHDIGDKFVCEGCFGDDAIKDFIRRNSEAKHCDYCGLDSEDSGVSVARIDKVMAVIIEGIEQEWADPVVDGVSWISREGGWQSLVYDTRELFTDHIKDELGLDGGSLLDDIVESVGDRQWCRKDHLRLPPGEDMIYGWEHFSRKVKYETRYRFFGCSDDASYGNPDEKPPSEVLRMIGESVQEIGLIRTIAEGSRFFRGRVHEANTSCDIPIGLGPPPPESACSNRMSPAGIPMFYGASDAETVIAETPKDKHGDILTIGAFDAIKVLTVLDLCSMPPFPSLFDRNHRHLRGRHTFLRDFVADLSSPIERDGREHIEYVPTQIVTEYFRHQFRTADGQRVQGILYPSSRREGGRCCVLFCSQDNCTEKPRNSWKEANQWLRLDVESITRQRIPDVNGPGLPETP